MFYVSIFLSNKHQICYFTFIPTIYTFELTIMNILTY
nr:MAG TPA: hypothetical protein [Caudoviricetes sp.]